MKKMSVKKDNKEDYTYKNKSVSYARLRNKFSKNEITKEKICDLVIDLYTTKDSEKFLRKQGIFGPSNTCLHYKIFIEPLYSLPKELVYYKNKLIDVLE